jgi:uncharacterized protein
MRAIAEDDIKRRVRRDNPWWEEPTRMPPEEALPKRAYFAPLVARALASRPRRATVLMGPRRVGKTVLLKQLVAKAMREGADPRRVMYVSVDTPVYSGFSLERFLELAIAINGIAPELIMFDEIQYLRDWELHLKDAVDSHRDVRFVASGSAAAALKLKSRESGAGRFSEFVLPPLTFFEYVAFVRADGIIDAPDQRTSTAEAPIFVETSSIDELNRHFLDYLNHGGYPEAVLDGDVREGASRYIKSDIIDKVLLKDLPNLYGIQEIQELNNLFSYIAYNAGQETNLEGISRASGISKPTIRKYIEYLESAFLIIRLRHVDENCRTLARERNFKLYLTNPSMRSALFEPVAAEDRVLLGHLVESAVFAQWQGSAAFPSLRYARWRGEGEIDLVGVRVHDQRPRWIGEIKWSDRIVKTPNEELANLAHFRRRNASIERAVFTTRTQSGTATLDGVPVTIVPSAIYCYTVGRDVIRASATT